MDGHHHLNLRKRIFEKFEHYPNPDALKRFLDKIMLGVALIGPLATLPQVYQVFMTQDAKGLSIFTWTVWTVFSIIWLLYGMLHKETPIVLSNLISIVLQSAVVVAILLYS